MTTLDDELRNALRREEPPAGFMERVLSTAAGGDSKSVGTFWERALSVRRRLIGWAAAAVLAAAVAGGFQYRAIERARDERARGEAAKEQVMQALRIASQNLQVVRAKIKEIGS